MIAYVRRVAQRELGLGPALPNVKILLLHSRGLKREVGDEEGRPVGTELIQRIGKENAEKQ